MSVGVSDAPDSASAFFIVGTGRCGTSLFKKLLRSHPDVYIPEETHWIPHLFHAYGLLPVRHDDVFRVMESFYMAKGRTSLARILRQNKLDVRDFKRDLISRLSQDGMDTLPAFLTEFYRYFAERNHATIWGDKTPDYGMCMGIIRVLWPQARFIHVVRDGRDVALSMSRNLSFRLQAAWGVNHWWSLAWERHYRKRLWRAKRRMPVDKLFRLWQSRTDRMRDESTRLPSGTYMEVRYEDVLRDPGREVERAAEFLGFPAAGDWVSEAIVMVDRDNLHKNDGDPEHDALTRAHSSDLRRMGFLE